MQATGQLAQIAKKAGFNSGGQLMMHASCAFVFAMRHTLLSLQRCSMYVQCMCAAKASGWQGVRVPLLAVGSLVVRASRMI